MSTQLKRKPQRSVSRTTGWTSKKRKTAVTNPVAALRRSRMLKRRHNTSRQAYTLSRPLVNLGTSWMPMAFRTRLVYISNWSDVTVTATGAKDYVFKGNDPYDPYDGAGGYGCHGWTELAAIYGRYKCIGSRCTIQAKYSAGTNFQTANVWPALTNTAVNTDTQIMARPDVARKSVYNDGTEAVVTHTARTASIFNVKDCDTINFQALTNASPASVWYWHTVLSGTQDDVSKFRVTIEYYVIFFDMKTTSPPAL